MIQYEDVIETICMYRYLDCLRSSISDEDRKECNEKMIDCIKAKAKLRKAIDRLKNLEHLAYTAAHAITGYLMFLAGEVSLTTVVEDLQGIVNDAKQLIEEIEKEGV